MESNPGQCLFTLDDAFFPVAYGGKRFLDCVWVRLLPMGLRDDMQERSYLTRSLYCPWGERKTLRVWVRLLWCPRFITKKKKKRGVRFWPTREPIPPTPLIPNHTNITKYLFLTLGRPYFSLSHLFSFFSHKNKHTHISLLTLPPVHHSTISTIFSGKIITKLCRNL